MKRDGPGMRAIRFASQSLDVGASERRSLEVLIKCKRNLGGVYACLGFRHKLYFKTLNETEKFNEYEP